MIMLEIFEATQNAKIELYSIIQVKMVLEGS